MKAIIALSIVGIATLFTGVFNMKNRAVWVAITGLFVALTFTVQDWNTSVRYFSDMIYFNNYAVAFTSIIIVITGLILLLCSDHYRTANNTIADIYGLILFAVVGAIIMVSYQNLAMLFLGIEILSIPLYILAGSNRNDLSSNEASLKYFLMGAFASGFLLFGIALVFGATNSFNLDEIHAAIVHNGGTISPMLSIGVLLILVGFLFKVSAAPFHFWAPDVYEGSPTVITAFMATVVKTAGFAAFFRLFSGSFLEIESVWFNILWVVTVLTLSVGNLTALFQKGMKRLLAYSSISHAGFLMLALLVLSDKATNALIYYSAAYGLSTICAFAVLLAVKEKRGNDSIESFKGLGKENPFLGFFFTIALLSLAGIPPLAGFFGKYYMFASALEVNLKVIVIIAVINAIIGIYYYLRVINIIWSSPDESTADHTIQIGFTYKTVIFVSALLIILIGILPEFLITLI